LARRRGILALQEVQPKIKDPFTAVLDEFTHIKHHQQCVETSNLAQSNYKQASNLITHGANVNEVIEGCDVTQG